MSEEKTIEEIKSRLSRLLFGPNTGNRAEDQEVAFDALTELGEHRSWLKDLQEQMQNVNKENCSLHAKLDKAKEGFKTIEGVDRTYVNAHGYEESINNIIGIAQQALKSIEANE